MNKPFNFYKKILQFSTMDQFGRDQYYFPNDDYYFPDNDADLYQYSVYPYDNYYFYPQQMPSSPQILDEKPRKKRKTHDSSHHHKKESLSKSSLNCEPICIAIGDIEGNVQKLRSVINFIKQSTFNFIFIGDIFDDISDSSPTRKQGFKCIELVSDFFSPVNEPYDLTFKSIQFTEKKFYEIQNRVKFVAGNSECDVLKDIIDTKNVKQNSKGKFIFGKDKYQKTFSEKQLTLLYLYFKNCCGVISLNKPKSKNQNNFEYVDSVFFRHSPEEFNHSHKIICQMPKEKMNSFNYDCNISLLIVGHVHYFGPLLSSSPDCQIYSIDTSSLSKKQNEADNRVAIVLYNQNTGFFVEPYYYY